ncbi:MAG: MBL fold metallo-hydrolase [Anaerosomatales bacterium]|nr:MBL fold metallo-hydrolase [Anaerosomatales bacterium]MDT8433176.1 MBL fold metallo-hydrolase [Anaerosomatales bacterium]
MRAQRVVLGPLDTNCWIAADGADGPAVVIDPADDAGAVLDALAGTRVAAVVLTHCHFDHLAGAAALLEATGAPLMVHEADAPFITHPEGTGGALFGFDHVAPETDRVLVAGDVVEAGSLALEVLHTPGHTPGGICLYTPGHLFSGDTLFAGSVGRTDFPRGDGRALRDSIASWIAPLPDDTAVHPGHGPDTTIGRERRINPFFPRA